MTALLGGWHCAGMCGPIATLASSSKEAFYYQAGRLLSYLLLGFLGGRIGQIPFQMGWALAPGPRLWINLAIAGVAAWLMLTTWKLKVPLRLYRYLWQARTSSRWINGHFALGVLNGFLPCVWLYGFLVAGIASGIAIMPVILMGALWLGSLPWLMGFSFFGGRIFQWLRKRPRAFPYVQITLMTALFLALIGHQLPH